MKPWRSTRRERVSTRLELVRAIRREEEDVLP